MSTSKWTQRMVRLAQSPRLEYPTYRVEYRKLQSMEADGLPVDEDGLVEELAGGDEEGVPVLVAWDGGAAAHDDDQSLQEGRVWSTDEYWRFTSRRLPTFGCDPEPWKGH